MSITIQHIAVHTENMQATASFDERDANGVILRHSRAQFTLSPATRDALLAEATGPVNAALGLTPQDLTALLTARDSAKSELAALTEQVATKAAELAALDVATAKVAP